MFAPTAAFEKGILAARKEQHASLVAQRRQEAYNRKVYLIRVITVETGITFLRATFKADPEATRGEGTRGMPLPPCTCPYRDPPSLLDH
jgi:hypothetical protein